MPVLPNQPLPNYVGQNSSIGSQIGAAFTSSLTGAVGVNPFQSRQNVATMFKYSGQGGRTTGPGELSAAVSYPQAAQDWRVRISLAPGANYFYKDPSNSLLSPLTESGTASNSLDSAIGGAFGTLFGAGSSGQRRIGVVFPYTPTITVTHTANYTAQKLTHNNYTNYFYDNSEVQPITISGEFTVQNVNEGQYLLATVYFFRSITKMFFGQDQQAGNPPPIVYLNGYGQYYLPNVPCVCTSFSHTMPDAVDYIDVPQSGIGFYDPSRINPVLNSTRLPTTSTVSVTLQPVYSRVSQSQGFSLNDFARGALVNARGTQTGVNPVTAFGSTTTPLNGGSAGAGGFL